MSERGEFFGLLLIAVAGFWVATGSLGEAIGGLVVVIPVSMVLGAAVLWLSRQVSGFVRGMRNPEGSAPVAKLTIWRGFTLALLLGLPIWILVTRALVSVGDPD